MLGVDNIYIIGVGVNVIVLVNVFYIVFERGIG